MAKNQQASNHLIDLERYRRQLAIDGWGEKAQEKLSHAHVTVVGAGGLGSPVLLYLTAAGVGHIRIIDGDTLSLSNLNRQILYGDALIGLPKAESTRRKLKELNPSVEIETIPARIDPDSMDLHLPTEGIMVDCLDNFETRFLLNRHAVENHLPLVHAGVEGLYGQLTTIIPEETPCLECIFAGIEKQTPRNNVAGNAADNSTVPDAGSTTDGTIGGPAGSSVDSSAEGPPVLGAAVGTIGCLQALEVLKLITGIGSLLKGRLLIFDGLDAQFDEISIFRNDKCPVCGV